MAVITLPVNIAIGRDGLTWGQQRYDLVSASDAGGATQVRPMGPPRWTVSLRSPAAMTNEEAAVWRSWLLKHRGRNNHAAIYNVNQPVPRGTARGTMFLKVAASAGATSITVTGSGIFGTVSQGDGYQIGSGVGSSQLVHAVEDSTSSPATQQTVNWTNTATQTVNWTNSSAQTVTWTRGGTLTITFEPPLRYDFPAGTLVTWNKPVAYFKSANDATDWTHYTYRVQKGFAFDGVEDWTP